MVRANTLQSTRSISMWQKPEGEAILEEDRHHVPHLEEQEVDFLVIVPSLDLELNHDLECSNGNYSQVSRES